MKKWIIITISLCFSILSCENDRNDGLYCVNTIKSKPGTTVLSKSEMEVVKNLFDRNKLDYKKYLFTRFQKDELGNHHIRCFQFANNLLVFTSDAIFHFGNNGNYSSLSGDLIKKINLNTISSMTKDNVVEKFIDILNDDELFFGIHPEDKEKIISGCFDLEFGYYNLNAGISYADEKFTKAWKIIPSNKEYPFAYINDDNSKIIYYDNGIRF